MDEGRTDDADRALAAARVAEAAARRRDRRREAELAGSEITLRGVLGGLAELAAWATIERGGHRTVVAVRSVGSDMVAVADEAGRTGFLRLAAVAVVEPVGVIGTPIAAEPTATARTFADAVADLCGTGEVTLLRTVQGTELRGLVSAAGSDVVELRQRGEPAAAAYVALDSLSEVWSSSRG